MRLGGKKPLADGDSDKFLELRLIDPLPTSVPSRFNVTWPFPLLKTDANMRLTINSGFD